MSEADLHHHSDSIQKDITHNVSMDSIVRPVRRLFEKGGSNFGYFTQGVRI